VPYRLRELASLVLNAMSYTAFLLDYHFQEIGDTAVIRLTEPMDDCGYRYVEIQTRAGNTYIPENIHTTRVHLNLLLLKAANKCAASMEHSFRSRLEFFRASLLLVDV
jgi:hypothetical protein